MKLELHGFIDVNCYVIEDGGNCYIIDPGLEGDRIRTYVESKKLNVLGILLTHGHLDHIGAANCFQVPVYLHENEKEFFLNDTLNGFKMFRQKRPYDAKSIEICALKEGSTLPLGNKTISVLHTPGHTAGSVCYLFEQELYSGDTLFFENVGRCDLPTGNSEELSLSIKRLLKTLPENCTVYPGHGETTSIRHEKEHNPWYH